MPQGEAAVFHYGSHRVRAVRHGAVEHQHGEVGRDYVIIGEIQHAKGDYEAAIKSYETAIGIFQDLAQFLHVRLV